MGKIVAQAPLSCGPVIHVYYTLLQYNGKFDLKVKINEANSTF